MFCSWHMATQVLFSEANSKVYQATSVHKFRFSLYKQLGYICSLLTQDLSPAMGFGQSLKWRTLILLNKDSYSSPLRKSPFFQMSVESDMLLDFVFLMHIAQWTCQDYKALVNTFFPNFPTDYAILNNPNFVRYTRILSRIMTSVIRIISRPRH